MFACAMFCIHKLLENLLKIVISKNIFADKTSTSQDITGAVQPSSVPSRQLQAVKRGRDEAQ